MKRFASLLRFRATLSACLLAVLLLGGAGAAQEIPSQPRDRPAALRVLFIGNSYTYYNDLPGILERLAAAARKSPAMEADWTVAPGATLERHWSVG